MEQFVVSARKYRPSTFQSVIGQRTVTNTLQSAIRQGKVSHGYLFCGPRGVGKTTCARILAKTINCKHLSPEGEACNACDNCKAINAQRSLNVYELDAASNNKVENMRDLVSMVSMPPPSGEKRVFIIDEVHMLTKEAFNAFLKTLEEPPPYAVFVLATTEKQLIPATILSRCQVFDFSRISVNDTIEYLAEIAKKEHVTYEPEALNLIALKADGGMRDALSTFDQVVSFSDGELTSAKVNAALNLLDINYYFQITDAIQAHDFVSALRTLDAVMRQGFDVTLFLEGLAGHIRNLLVAANEKSAETLELGDEITKRYVAGAKTLPGDLLVRSLMLITDAEGSLRYSSNQRLHVEVLLVSLCSPSLLEKKNG